MPDLSGVKEIDWGTQPMPPCDICNIDGVDPAEGIYDAKTQFGPWGNLCTPHMQQHGPIDRVTGRVIKDLAFLRVRKG